MMIRFQSMFVDMEIITPLKPSVATYRYQMSGAVHLSAYFVSMFIRGVGFSRGTFSICISATIRVRDPVDELYRALYVLLAELGIERSLQVPRECKECRESILRTLAMRDSGEKPRNKKRIVGRQAAKSLRQYSIMSQ